MNPVRLLGKLTTKGLRLDGGAGGPVLIPSTDVAAALGMGSLDPVAVLVGLAKYADDNVAQLQLRDWCVGEFRRRSVSGSWGSLSGRYLQGLALLVVFELVNPTVCPHCGGRGMAWMCVPASDGQDGGDENVPSERWLECGRCKGSGRVRLTLRDRAAIAEITRSTFSQHWSQRADSVLALLHSHEEVVLRHLWRHFVDAVA